MAFVNEFIPSEDVKNYHLVEIDKRFIVGGTNASDWTIDRERDVYLRNVANGGGGKPEIRNQTVWTLYWHGDLLVLRLDLLGASGERGEPGWSHWRLAWFCGTSGLPAHLKGHKEQILEVLKEALTVYQGGGVYSGVYSSYSVTLDIAEGCML